MIMITKVNIRGKKAIIKVHLGEEGARWHF